MSDSDKEGMTPWEFRIDLGSGCQWLGSRYLFPVGFAYANEDEDPVGAVEK